MRSGDQLDSVLRVLTDAGGALRPGEISAVLGIDHDTRARLLRALRGVALVEGNKRQIKLTAAGWARAGAADGAAAGPILDAALAGWPYAHRAFVTLMVGAVIARCHLAGDRPRGHLGFMAVGETGTGKTAMVELACHLLGLDFSSVRRFLYTETVGSLLGRREQEPGKAWKVDPSEAALGALLLLDEFDKAEEPVRRAGWVFFQGETIARHEGQVWPIRPVPVLALNPPRSGDRCAMLRPEYRRRSLVLDTGYMRGRSTEVEELMTSGYYARSQPGALSLAALRPPASRLDERGLAVLRTVRNALTEAGAEEFPGIAALELAALGLLAVSAGEDHALAAYATAVSYLQVTATVPGQVVDGWEADAASIHGWFGDDGGPVAEAIERGRAGRELARRAARSAVTAQVMLSDEVTVAIAELAERLQLASEQLQRRRLSVFSDEQKAAAAGVKAGLGKLRQAAGRCRSAQALEVVHARSEPMLAAAADIIRCADDMRDRAKAERERAERERRQLAAQAIQDRKDVESAARAAQAHRRSKLREVVAMARPLEQMWRRTATRPAERPFERLRDIGIGSTPILVYVPPQPVPRPAGWRRLVDAMSGPAWGEWQVTGTPVAFPGTADRCPALAAWGDNTKAALEPALALLYAAENQLSCDLGQAVTRKRIPLRTFAAAPLAPGWQSVQTRLPGAPLALPPGHSA